MRRIQQLMQQSPIIRNKTEAHRWLSFQKQTQNAQHLNNSTGNAHRWRAAMHAISLLPDNLASYQEIDQMLPEYMNTAWVVSYLLHIGFLEKRGMWSYYRINRQWQGNANGNGNGGIQGNGGKR